MQPVEMKLTHNLYTWQHILTNLPEKYSNPQSSLIEQILGMVDESRSLMENLRKDRKIGLGMS